MVQLLCFHFAGTEARGYSSSQIPDRSHLHKVHKVRQDVPRVRIQLRLEQTFQDPERVPIVDLPVSTSWNHDRLVQRDERALALVCTDCRAVGLAGSSNSSVSVQLPSRVKRKR